MLQQIPFTKNRLQSNRNIPWHLNLTINMARFNCFKPDSKYYVITCVCCWPLFIPPLLESNRAVPQSTVLKYTCEVRHLYFNVSIVCYFILLLPYNSEVNILFSALHLFNCSDFRPYHLLSVVR